MLLGLPDDARSVDLVDVAGRVVRSWCFNAGLDDISQFERGVCVAVITDQHGRMRSARIVLE
ncbi:MAG: hypothetical protein IPK70_02095 [Flavobacteriales bacterium]|jgi:hypothetical protein|nr:hypothetical protein [Flavobacteriales bacterium]